MAPERDLTGEQRIQVEEWVQDQVREGSGFIIAGMQCGERIAYSINNEPIGFFTAHSDDYTVHQERVVASKEIISELESAGILAKA